MTTNEPAATVWLGSDNQAGAHPAIVEAVAAAATGYAPAYGDDAWTQRVEARMTEVFERPCEVFLVATGTAANAMILSALCPPWGAIYTHQGAHIINDENTAPELFTGGARQIGIAGEQGKPCIESIAQCVETAQIHGVHNAKPAAISLTNATESGTVYTPAEMAGYGELARRYHLALHVDGARFANAVAAGFGTPADLTWRAGVDVLTFGATKNGAIAAEAVVFFNDKFSADFAYRRKRAGHLWSKHRFLAAQFDAYLADDLWLKNATHANAMARKLADGVASVPGVELPWPTHANEVFPVLPNALAAALRSAGFDFYDWPDRPNMVRLVTSYATRLADVEAFIRAAHTESARL